MFHAAELLYIHKCHDRLVADLSPYSRYEDYRRPASEANNNELLLALDTLLQRKPTLVADNRVNDEIGESIGINRRQIRNLHTDTYRPNRTATMLRLNDLVYSKIKMKNFPFSMYGYEVNSRLAEAIRHNDMKKCKKEWLTYTKRIKAVQANVEIIAKKVFGKGEVAPGGREAAWSLSEQDWDDVVFFYHYFTILSWLALHPRNKEIEKIWDNREEFDSLRRERGSDRELMQIIDAKREHDKLKEQGEIVSKLFLAMLRNWRYYGSGCYQDHNVWTYLLELRILLNRISIKWIDTPREARGSKEVLDLIDKTRYIDIHLKYSDIFPKNMAHPFNLLGTASQLRLEDRYEDFYRRLVKTDRKFLDLERLRNDEFADGDFDNFVEYWKRRYPRWPAEPLWSDWLRREGPAMTE